MEIDIKDANALFTKQLERIYKPRKFSVTAVDVTKNPIYLGIITMKDYYHRLMLRKLLERTSGVIPGNIQKMCWDADLTFERTLSEIIGLA